MITAHLPPIYLASASPRRQALLSQIGVEFTVIEHQVEEQALPNEPADRMVKRLAIEKARDAALRLGVLPQRPVLGADTMVVIGEETLGKPCDQEDALRMLSLLSGQTHRVLSAVALVHNEIVRSCFSISHVSFAAITQEQALKYWQTGEPVDKAGAYGIQGMAGIFIKHIEGSYSGIMGLPLYETYSLLHEFVSEILDTQ